MTLTAALAAAALAAGCGGGSGRGSEASGPASPADVPAGSTPGGRPPDSPAPDPTAPGSLAADPTAPGGPAGPVPTGSASPGGSALRELGPRDSGTTIPLAVGDRLRVTLSANRLTARWTLTAYPRRALTADLAGSPLGAFDFVARSPGSGRILLTRSGCGAAGKEPCPSGRGLPATPLTWTVIVQVR